jgi:hypothetical protein
MRGATATVTRFIAVIAAVGLLVGWPCSGPAPLLGHGLAVAQQVPPSGALPFPIETTRTDRFDGRVIVRGSQQRPSTAGPSEIQIALRNWIIPNGQRIERFPEPGFLLVQVRSGEDLVTVIDGQRQLRQVDEFFVVPAGSSMSVETGNDTVIIQTLAIRSP